MTVLEAQEILNDNDQGKFYTLEETSAYLKLSIQLTDILVEQTKNGSKND